MADLPDPERVRAEVTELRNETVAHHSEAMKTRAGMPMVDHLSDLVAWRIAMIRTGKGVLETIEGPEPRAINQQQANADEDDDDSDDVRAMATHNIGGGRNDDWTPSIGLNERTRKLLSDRHTRSLQEVDRAAKLSFFEKLATAVSAKRSIQPGLALEPFKTNTLYEQLPHQTIGAKLLLRTLDPASDFKSSILADPPGMGKSHTVLQAIVEAWAPGDGPSLIVVPAGCMSQWKAEADHAFGDALPVMVLTDSTTHPFELFAYKAIIVSYGFLMTEFNRRHRFARAMAEYKPGKLVPIRPWSCLLSDLWDTVLELRDAKYKFLVLDEAHTIKNPATTTFQAVEALRWRFEACLMITATPLDNSWPDLLSYLMLLDGHPVLRMKTLKELVIHPDLLNSKDKKKVAVLQPTGVYRQRYHEILDAITIARPATASNLQEPTRQIIRFELAKDELQRSNAHFERYKAAKGRGDRPQVDEEGQPGRKRKGKRTNFKAFYMAMYESYHPLLTQYVDMKSRDDETGTEKFTQAHLQKLADLEERLAQGSEWKSRRVKRVVDIIRGHRDDHPGDKILIIDECVPFLCILKIAMEKMKDPLTVFSYDGRIPLEDREQVMKDFHETTGEAVLLCSRATGGQGLNIQCANVLIRCGPWWKQAWDWLAEGRINRLGQSKPTYIFELAAEDCNVEQFIRRKRAAKVAFNTSARKEITLPDFVQPLEPRDLRLEQL